MNYIESYRPSKFTMEIPKSRFNDWLYYETGFEQLYLNPEITRWMLSQGWVSGRDWKLEKRRSSLLEHASYHLTFNDAAMADSFLLRWSC